MKDYAKRVNLPADSAINGGLSVANNGLCLQIFGIPSTRKSKTCASPTNPRLMRLTETRDVGPFRCTGLKPALDSLERIFKKVKAEKPELYEAIKTAGMQCCRLQRTSNTAWSNHSFGCAIDLYCGSSVVPQGVELTQQGVLELYPYFHNEGWYWGAEFGQEDAMHYEVSAEKLREWHNKGLLK